MTAFVNPQDIINTYLKQDFLKELIEFFKLYGSKYHNGIEDEEALDAFIIFRNPDNPNILDRKPS